MAFGIFFPQSIAGDPSADGLAITYLLPCTNLPYLPIYSRMNSGAVFSISLDSFPLSVMLIVSSWLYVRKAPGMSNIDNYISS